MNIQEAKNEIKHTVAAYLSKDANGAYRIPVIRQRPILLMGPPGIGKTQIMEQIAQECGIGLVSYTITHHTRQSAVGLPMIRQEEFQGKTYSVTEYTMSEIIASVYRAISQEGKQEGILFIDEINCVSETLTPAMLQFLQCKTFGNEKVPDGWLIVAAGNPPEYNKSVRDFDMVTLDRVRYVPIEADLGVWKQYAMERHIHGAILSYLELRPKNFYQVEETVDGLQFVTARGWEDMSALMKVYEDLDIPVTEEVVREFIRSDEVAEDVNAYFELYRKYQDDYKVDQILSGNVPSEIYARLMQADLDERYSVTNLIIDALSDSFQKLYQEKVVVDKRYQQLKQNTEQLEEGALQEARKEFRVQADRLKEHREAVSAQLEHAFDFMEAAFERGQELLIFITGLTMGKESAIFLAENPSQRYLRYNEELLAGTRRTEILSRLER